MEMKATDLSARLLATENITVVRNAQQTASFDIKSRVLSLPIWKDMSPEIEDMLIGHEVGHALYTGEEYMKPIRENPKMKSYLNILEDVRIEKLIKRKYPGLRKRMNEGYKQLNDKDFFGVSKMPLDTLNLIDRINLYFKAGFQCGVKFDAEEKILVKRAEVTETIDDVIKLAEEVYAFSKERAEQAQQERQELSVELSDDSEDEMEQDFDFDEEGFEQEEDFDRDMDSPPSGSGKPDKEEEVQDTLESKTETVFQDKLAETADTSTQYIYYEIIKPNFDPVVGFKTILKELSEELDYDEINSYYKRRLFGDKQPSEYDIQQANSLNKFKNDSTSSVNYLVKEFEMKKSADMYKRAQTSKVGSLDMKKVYAFKLKDDLFKRVTTISEGKNHGMLFLLDWSGSMSDVIEDTLKQVINLAMFCNKVQIPYRVLAFTSQRRHSDQERSVYQELSTRIRQAENEGKDFVYPSSGFHLLELFSNKMSMTEFNMMVRKILDPRVFWRDGFDLGGTPLNEALLWVYENLGEYMKNNRIQKMNFITLTDGQGSQLSTSGSFSAHNYDPTDGKRYRQRHFLRDSFSKKSYEITRDANTHTEALISMIKSRYDVRTIGFFLCPNKTRWLEQSIRDNVPGYKGDYKLTIDKMRKDFRSQGFYSMSGTGRDDLFIVPTESTKISEDSLTVNSDMSARKLATNLGKYMNVKKTSRVLLSRFVDMVA